MLNMRGSDVTLPLWYKVAFLFYFVYPYIVWLQSTVSPFVYKVVSDGAEVGLDSGMAAPPQPGGQLATQATFCVHWHHVDSLAPFFF